MNINILDFLMKNDIILHCNYTGYSMTVDESLVLGGEFVVYDDNIKSRPDLYRGFGFEKAVKILNGDE